MATTTTYMVQTFNHLVHGPVTDGQVRCRSPAEAIRTGAALVPTKAGAVAIETTSEQLTVQHVRALGQWGDVPADYVGRLTLSAGK